MYTQFRILPLVALVIAVLFGMTNAVVAIASGVTPNMSSIGIVVAALVIGTASRNKPNERSENRKQANLLQTAASAGNAGAAALVFTAPLLVLQGTQLSLGLLVRLGLACAGGISLAVVLVSILVASTDAPKQTDGEPESEGPEAVAIRDLIFFFFEDSRRSTLLVPIMLGVASALLSGALYTLDSSAFGASLPIPLSEKSIEIGWNPLVLALGVVLPLGTSRGLLAGTVIALLLSGIELSAEPTSTSSPVSMPAAILLGIAALQLVVMKASTLLLLPATAKPRWKTQLLATHLGSLPVPLVAATILAGLAAIAFEGGLSGFSTLVAPTLALIGGAGAVILAERFATIVGVTMNPSSSISLIVALAFIGVSRQVDSPTLVLTCCFATAAASAAADLAQDLLVGRSFDTSPAEQTRYKWAGAMLAVPFTVIVLGLALQIVPARPDAEHPEWFSVPQAKALGQLVRQDNVVTATPSPSPELRASASSEVTGRVSSGTLTRGGLLFCLVWLIGMSPILTGVGMILSTKTTAALVLGGLFGRSLSIIFSRPNTPRTDIRSRIMRWLDTTEDKALSTALKAIGAAVVGACGVGSLLGLAAVRAGLAIPSALMSPLALLATTGVGIGLVSAALASRSENSKGSH